MLVILTLVLGLVILTAGAELLVRSSSKLAAAIGISPLVVGLTVVAFGTSAPELAVSVQSTLTGQSDVALGNVVGSNIFNIMGVLGISSLVSAEGVAVSDAAFGFDIPVMIVVAIACLPIFFTEHRIARWEGALFLLYYCAYTGFMVVAATVPSLTRNFAAVMLGFVVPLTAITLVIGTVRAYRSGNAPDADARHA